MAPVAVTEIEDGVLEEYIALTTQMRTLDYLEDPVFWVEDRLGERLWSKQKEIMRSVRDNRRTAVPSCFDAGKSFIAARIAAWWIDSHPPGKAGVVSTASKFAQVRAILWRELRRAHAKGNLPGRVNQTEWHLPIPGGTEELVAYGRKPDDDDETGFHGFHGRWMLGLIDEASGVSTTLCNSIENLIANEDSRLLAIGNPEDPTSEFKDMCSPGSGWKVIQIKAWSTPNFTDEALSDDPVLDHEIKSELISKIWVEERRKKWGVNSSMYISNVEAEFPESTADGLIPISWIRAAQARSLDAQGVSELGVDVGAGRDKSTIGHRRGPVFRIKHRDTNPDTMHTCGEAVAVMHDTEAELVKVDSIGIGKGVADRGAEQIYDDGTEEHFPFVGVNVSSKPRDEKRFINLRAEGYWTLRERFEDGTIDIDSDDEDLAEQLVELRFKRTSSGKIQMESKDQMIERLGHSPDDSDCCMLAFLILPELPKKVKGAVWGI